MNDRAVWQQQNDEYLACALDWLHLRLRRLAAVALQEAPARQSAGREERSRSWSFLGLGGGDDDRDRLALQASRGSHVEDRLARAREALAATSASQPPPALLQLAERFGLSPFERDLLLLCAAMELDTRTAELCARAQDDPGRSYPTFALALALLDEPAWEALSPQRPLRYWQLIEISQPGAQPLTTSALRADERIVNAIKGLEYLDDRLTSLLVPLEVAAAGSELPPSQEASVEAVQRLLAQAEPIIQLVGPDAASKQLVAARAVADYGVSLLRLPAAMFPSQPADVELLARLWQRESLMLPLALYLEAAQGGEAPDGDGQSTSLQRFLLRSTGILLVDTPQPRQGPGWGTAVVDVARPTPFEQHEAWQRLLGEQAGENPRRLAGQFNLNLDTIGQIVRVTCADAGQSSRDLDACLWRACRSRTRPQLGGLAQPLEPKAGWDDIVLPEEQMALLHQIAGQVEQRITVYDRWGFRERMNRGLGISALFAGPSGTGKTMAAEVIARELDLDLYRIDLSSVVSKYIGETEKNLRKLFDAAEDGGAVLFFDEADALFGKRSEVKDSHDRYANVEISYLLQRMESYRGLAVLATNMKNALDPAFVRRLRFIVDFPFPGPAERLRIWRGVFPPGLPVEGLDYEHLARLNLSGGSIHNVALNAAFMAAGQGQTVAMPLLLAAARGEFRKTERPANEADFRWKVPARPGGGS
jgi:hypothetical protein